MAGKYYEELHVGMVMRHELSRTITEGEHMLFCAMTMNPQPLHIDAHFAAQQPFGKPLVNGLFTMSLAVGISVQDTTMGTIIANLGYENVQHPHPVFHGDTLYVETEIIAMRESQSRPDCGIVTMTHTGRNQDGVIVVEVTRSALFLKRPR
ncbi:MAG: MaoC family dehydratase [bacterium]|nr:MaoC family dehydratase [bacterium]